VARRATTTREPRPFERPAGCLPMSTELLAVAAVLLPLIGALLAFALPRLAGITGLAVAGLLTADVVVLARRIANAGDGLRIEVGGWSAPLGIALEVDGLSVFMLLTTALASAAILVYGSGYFAKSNRSASFTPLALLLLTGMNALFLSADVFNLYVTLEIIGLAAVGLVALAGGPEALTGAMRYLLVTFLASLMYLLGVALLYHLTGFLDLRGIGETLHGGPAAWIALGMMASAMLLKSALFPLHFWLPPAHSSAQAPVSALLSALVVKASIYVLLRLWLEVMPPGKEPLGQLLGALGALAVLWGSIQALRQQELKLLVAYSTVAQIGYLFIPFALDSAAAVVAWQGAIYLVLSHALAKSAMFLAVGNIQAFGGDRLEQLDRIVQRLPLTAYAFALAGVTIAGLPPSGGFIAKWLMLEALLTERRWWLASVVVVGGLLASIYVFRVVGPAFTQGRLARPARRVPRTMEWVAFGLGLATIALGFTAPPLLRLLDAGAPFATFTESGP
jgi:multicomponent Na+:H+ antiporter subunit D